MRATRGDWILPGVYVVLVVIFTILMLIALSACTPAPEPACPPPPPSLICKYGPKLSTWATGWIGRHVLSNDDEAVAVALKRDIADRCGS